MSSNYYRKCKICDRDVHSGDFCECAYKADPWGSIKKHIDGNRKQIKQIRRLSELKAEFDAVYVSIFE